MQKVDLSNTEERKKLIAAVVLGFAAIVFLWWALFGFGSSKPTPRTAANSNSNSSTTGRTPNNNNNAQPTVADIKSVIGSDLEPILATYSTPPATEAQRNIFIFYEKPPAPVKIPETPTPTPTPTPPVLLANVSPVNVYAGTGAFKLEVTGDKFTADLRVIIDGRELPTRYIGPQQISAEVPAQIIAAAGPRQVMLRSPNGAAYSNPVSFNVAQPPTPNFTYVGIIGKPRFNDTALVQDRSNRDILNVQRGDLLGGRFRVTSISEKELVVMDTNLKIRHALPFTIEGDRSYNPLQRPTPKVDSEDDEP